MRKCSALAVGLVLLVSGCELLSPPPDDSVVLTFDFASGAQGWQGGFADYAPEQLDSIQAVAEVRDLPAELGEQGTGFFIAGSNVSDDLFMYLVRRLGPDDGIEPGSTYRVEYQIVLASNAPSGCAGIGGAPGEAVVLKAGATDIEPKAEVLSNGVLRLNVDIGGQTTGGPAASVVDDIANGIPCEQVDDLANAPYVSLTCTHTHGELVRANDAGQLWLLVGTDSGFEGRTALYYQRIEATLTPVSPPSD